ncbi:hypothetical protein VDG1235_2905 [Verrucomicrobiia bacterium DG1235]|nr:hypothetical protein VDG1235_2905 [Verrucomicrobiae bacterium DG1235]
MAIRVLREHFQIDASSARSKSWEEFKDGSFDLVITVCDKARETCPVWPGQPIVAHWGSPDPAAFVGSEEETYRHFRDVALQITRRIDLLIALPIERLSAYSVAGEQSVRDIGEVG